MTFHVDDNEEARKKYRDATKIPENLKKYYGKVTSKTSASHVLADNPHAEYIRGGKYGSWKYHALKTSNPRYTNARETNY